MKKEKQDTRFRKESKNIIKIGGLLIIILILITGVVCLWYYSINTHYSTLCLNKVEEELGGKIHHIERHNLGIRENAYYYYGFFKFEGCEYMYHCSVIDKNNINVELDNFGWEITPNSN